MPPIEGIERAIAFRTRHDVRTIRGRTHGARRAVVIGGGLLGLEAARAVANRGIAVTVVHLAGAADGAPARRHRRPDARARAAPTQGIDVACDADDDRDPTTTASSSARRRDDRGRPRHRRRGRRPRDRPGAADGRAGRPRRPRRRLAAHEHPRRLGGRASAPSTAGCSSASSRRRCAMARAAAADIAGAPAAYLPARIATRLKVAGIDLFCSGELEGDDEVVALDTRAGHYRREVYRGGELVGSIVLGDPPRSASRDARRARLRLQRRHAPRDPRLRRDRPRRRQARRRAPRPAAAAARARCRSLLAEAAEVGFQAVQVEPAKAIEVLVRRPVEVGRAGRQSGRARGRRV